MLTGIMKSWQRRRLLGWLVPLILLAVAGFFLFFFVFNLRGRSVPASAVPEPAQRLSIAEPFQGRFYFNSEFGRSDFSAALIKAIDGAKARVEVAVYSLDHPAIRDALFRAARRGVPVTLLLSDKQKPGHDQVLRDPPAGLKRHDIATIAVGGFNGTMHDKFMIIDRGQPGARLFFGSYNFTALQEKFDPSFILETERPEIVKIFGEELDRIVAGRQGEKKARAGINPFAARIDYPDGFLEIWFGPQPRSGGLRERLIGLIGDARSGLDMMIWNLTDETVARRIGDAAATVPVRLLTDDYNLLGPDSVFPSLLARKNMEDLKLLDIRTDIKRNAEVATAFKQKDLNSFLHHHLLVADGKTVLFGTGNWSANGFYSNDESAMVSNLPAVVAAWQGAFRQNYEQAR